MKQIAKMEQINNYIVAAQQNRDKLIEELTRENKILKNSLREQKNVLKSQKKNESNTKIMNSSMQWITPMKNLEKQDTRPYLGSLTNIQKRASLKTSK